MPRHHFPEGPNQNSRPNAIYSIITDSRKFQRTEKGRVLSFEEKGFRSVLELAHESRLTGSSLPSHLATKETAFFGCDKLYSKKGFK